MAERTSRSTTRRTTPQSPPNSYINRTNLPQSPPRRTTRSTRSRSIDSESSRADLKRWPKFSKQATSTGATTDYEDLQNARRGKARAQSRILQDLATVVEDLSIPDPELPQDKNTQANQTPGRGKAIPKRLSGARSPEANSAFSGNTARISGSAPSWAGSDPPEEVSHGASKKSVKIEPGINVNSAPISPALFGPLDTGLQQINAPKQSIPKAGGLENSNIRFNSPKIIQGTAGYLKQTKANRIASGKFQTPPQQSSASVRNVPVAATANPSARVLIPNQKVSKLAMPSSVTAGTQMVLTTETAEKVFERSQGSTDASREIGLQPQSDWQHQDFEDSIAPSTESREDLNVMARRVEETKAQLEADNNKENFAELPGPSRSVQGGKKRHFIDPQPNAERLRFDDSQDSQQRGQPSRKRQRDGPETVVDNGDNQVYTTEVSSDEGFQQDRRAIGAFSKTSRTRAQNRVVREPVLHQRLSPMKARSAPRHGNLNDEPRAAVTQHEEEQTPEPTQFENYKKANELAKRNLAVLPKKVQTRKAWTQEETETLISLIGDHGISWKLLKEQDVTNGSLLGNRDQVALKDKARNMKFDYLKAGPFLPQNFENVPLNKMQTDKLRSLGIVYDPTTGQRGDGEIEAMDTDE